MCILYCKHMFIIIVCFREQLLKVLLSITSSVLSEGPTNGKDKTRGERLAQPLFQVRIQFTDFSK